MGVAHHLKTIDRISSITTSYWVENLRLLFLISKAYMNFACTKWLIVEIKWKNFKKDRKSFGTDNIKIWQKNTSGGSAFLEILQAESSIFKGFPAF